ncbi:MAG: hypothetical protein HFI39_12305 [Lachnospiraceae bacterium]|nr:hypothetical protein [Lachnospiraceae bacterium]
MRAYTKKEIVQSIGILKNACRKMKLMQCGDGDELLAQCQQLALAIGNQIEQSEQSDFVTVQYLEEFCELLYKLYICKNKSEYNQIIKEIGASLKKIERSVQEDIKNSPYEIVFMPYKASMWDALDSIYRAALKDEACHVTMMPVPYYNRNQKDGQVEVHYEGDQFPADIPVTDFRTYSLEAVHPDAIFIHNPYDQYNYVTQLPPEYFSTNLVHYTDHLVYIPYFITKGDSVKDQYCMMPAVQNAWRTFVQSEAVRKCYVKCGADPNRVIAAGSPKFDMVIQMQKNPPEIPTEWKRALEGRKVFLLNTHLNPVIQAAETIFCKLEQIFQLFEQRSDIALLWRPHPLSIETLKSMNPEMLKRYLRIVEQFKKLENGVYDDTADIHRAIAISDAYIGDGSSVVTMYGITGKPIYLLGMEANHIFADDIDSSCRFACGVMVDGVLWAPAENSNALYKVDLRTNTVEYAASFEKEDCLGKGLYHRAVLFEDRIYFVPFCAKYFAVYHLQTGQITYIDFIGPVNKAKFSEAIQYKNYLYLFPAKMAHVMRLNMQNEELDYFPECVADLEQITWLAFNEHSLFLGGMKTNETAWVVSEQTNCLIEYCMESNKYRKHFIGEKKEGFTDITSDGEKFYILSQKDEVIAWSCEKKEQEVIWKPSVSGRSFQFLRIVFLNDCLWLLPGHGDTVVSIDLKSKNVREIKVPEDYISLNSEKPKAYAYVVHNHTIILCPAYAKKILEIDCDLYEVKTKEVTFTEKSYKKRREYLIQSLSDRLDRNYSYSEYTVPLQCFVDFVWLEIEKYIDERGKYFQQMQCNIDGNCGESIWRAVRKDLG